MKIIFFKRCWGFGFLGYFCLFVWVGVWRGFFSGFFVWVVFWEGFCEFFVLLGFF